MYGVVGAGTAPKKVIEASLNDIGTDKRIIVPWYGKVTPGLEVVYDWVLDNEVTFAIVATEHGKPVPGVLRAAATTVRGSSDVTREIITELNLAGDGHTLVLWDESNEAESVRIATMSIDQGLPTLELNNGLVPIVFDGPQDEDPEDTNVSVDDLVVETVEDDISFDKETLGVMPAAVVKRMARDAGHNPKTKDEAISMLSGAEPEVDKTVSPYQGAIPAKMVVTFQNGSIIEFNLPTEMLNKVVELVASN